MPVILNLVEETPPSMSEAAATPPASLDFIREMIAADLSAGRNGGQVVTRFPPEPNGYLHIGHAKSICLNFGLAQEHAPNARCHLRFDDTNPTKEDVEYVESIKADVKWLGFDWGEHMFFASDYFEKLYLFAEQLISMGVNGRLVSLDNMVDKAAMKEKLSIALRELGAL